MTTVDYEPGSIADLLTKALQRAGEKKMRAQRLRLLGVWATGLFAAGFAGAIASEAMAPGAAFVGMMAGASGFACFRLWGGPPK